MLDISSKLKILFFKNFEVKSNFLKDWKFNFVQFDR